MIARWLCTFGTIALLFCGLPLVLCSTEFLAIYYEALTAVYLAVGGLLALRKMELDISPARKPHAVTDYIRKVLANDERFAGYFIILAAVSGLCMSVVHLYDAVTETRGAETKTVVERAMDSKVSSPAATVATSGKGADGKSSSDEKCASPSAHPN